VGAREITEARGGDWRGSYGLVPGPGHSDRDRSCKVWDGNGKTYVHSFAGDDWKDCRAHLGLDDDRDQSGHSPNLKRPPESLPARPSQRCFDLRRTSAPVDLVPDAVAYLQARKLWPLPKGCPLEAHAGAPYWESTGERPVVVGKYPTLLAPVVDIEGELVTIHCTYLEGGQKIKGREPRKQLSGTHGRVGCAVQLMAPGRILAVAEGIETALAAARLLKLPAWSCLNTSLLQAFQPPPGIERIVVAADNDEPGIRAAEKLKLKLQGTVPVIIWPSQGADYAADWEARS
jgi:hypothetical protein